MSQTQTHSEKSLIDQPTPDTKYSRRDIIENPFGRPYVIQSTYFSKRGSPMVHLRREHGIHDMYVTVTRLTEMVTERDWVYVPQ